MITDFKQVKHLAVILLTLNSQRLGSDFTDLEQVKKLAVILLILSSQKPSSNLPYYGKIISTDICHDNILAKNF